MKTKQSLRAHEVNSMCKYLQKIENNIVTYWTTFFLINDQQFLKLNVRFRNYHKLTYIKLFEKKYSENFFWRFIEVKRSMYIIVRCSLIC
jgi:hypothetical protein